MNVSEQLKYIQCFFFKKTDNDKKYFQFVKIKTRHTYDVCKVIAGAGFNWQDDREKLRAGGVIVILLFRDFAYSWCDRSVGSLQVHVKENKDKISKEERTILRTAI